MSWHNSFPKNNWTDYLKHHEIPFQLKPAEVKPFVSELLQTCQIFFEEKRFGKAIDILALGLLIDKQDFLTRLKKTGLLRHSSYVNGRDPVTGIAKHVFKNAALFKLTQNEVSYFEALMHIENLSVQMKTIYVRLKGSIRKHKLRKPIKLGEAIVKTSIIKSLLAINDYAFLNRQASNIFTSVEEIANNGYSLEDRSDAISFLISLCDEIIGIEIPDLLMNDDSFIKSSQCEELITDACLYKKYREAEILIESIGYICERDGKLFKIKHNDERTFKSMELSNIMGNTQKDSDSLQIQTHSQEYPSVEGLSEILHKKFPNMVELKKVAYTRYVLNFPSIIAPLISKDDIGTFREELYALEYVQNEMSLPLNGLTNYEIVKGLSINDFMVIDRVFMVMQSMYSERLKKLSTADNYLIVLNSMLVNLNVTQLTDIFKDAISMDKVLKYFEIISWTPGKKQFMDLQYSPVIQIDQHYLLPLSVMVHSRKIRNVTALLAKIGHNLKSDQIKLLKGVPEQLTESFSKQGFTCYTDLKVHYQGAIQSEGDIDFFAFKDGHLFIAECKDVADSVDPFEYRRINDYLTKAASQLNYIKSALADPKYQAYLSERVKIDLSNLKGIHFIIVPTARRMFGHSVEGYPVRNMHELTAYIRRGAWDFKLPGENMFSFKLWNKDIFEVSDLIMFCSNNSPHEELLKAMEPHGKPIGKNVEMIGYFLNAITAFENLKGRFRNTEHTE